MSTQTQVELADLLFYRNSSGLHSTIAYHILINNYKKGGQGQQTQSHDKDVRICIALVNQYTLCMYADKSHYC